MSPHLAKLAKEGVHNLGNFFTLSFSINAPNAPIALQVPIASIANRQSVVNIPMIPPKSTGFPTYRSGQLHIKDEKAGVFSNANDDDLEDLEVDYDNNVTDLYRFISNSQWQEALQAVRRNPIEAKTWVVRYHEDDTKGMMWRFLPIHSASARQPPEAVIHALIQAYPEGTECCDDQGKYALHYAAGNQASSGVVRALLEAFPSAATTGDPEGKLPLHWLAISGPFEPSVIQPLLNGSRNLYNIVDDEGWTPLDYARDGNYPYKQDMLDILQRHTSPQRRNSPNKNMAITSISPDLSYAQRIYQSPLGASNYGFASPKIKFSPMSSNKSTGNFSSYQSARSVNTTGTKGSMNKTLAKFNAQIVKLKAEAAFNEAEYEEMLVNQREEHDDAVAELEAAINQEVEKARKIKTNLAMKEQAVSLKEKRISSCDNELNRYNEQNSRLQNEINVKKDELRSERNSMGENKLRLISLQHKMRDMVNVQMSISQSLESIELDAKKASEARRQKLQGLFDDELQESREMSELTRVYSNRVGGPTIREALAQQKNLMKNCEIVLDECDLGEDVDSSY